MVKSVLFVVLVACGGSSKPAATTAPPPPAGDPTCPVEVAGTSVTAEDSATGAALVFVTTGDVAELRRRVAAMGARHNADHGAMGPLPTGQEQGGQTHHHDHDHAAMQAGSAAHGGSMIGVHSKATAEDIAGGVKLVFVAFPDGVAKIQAELRMHAQHLAAGTCAMEHPR